MTSLRNNAEFLFDQPQVIQNVTPNEPVRTFEIGQPLPSHTENTNAITALRYEATREYVNLRVTGWRGVLGKTVADCTEVNQPNTINSSKKIKQRWDESEDCHLFAAQRLEKDYKTAIPVGLIAVSCTVTDRPVITIEEAITSPEECRRKGVMARLLKLALQPENYPPEVANSLKLTLEEGKKRGSEVKKNPIVQLTVAQENHAARSAFYKMGLMPQSSLKTYFLPNDYPLGLMPVHKFDLRTSARHAVIPTVRMAGNYREVYNSIAASTANHWESK